MQSSGIAAFRPLLQVPGLGIGSIGTGLAVHGYRQQEYLAFPNKKLLATWWVRERAWGCLGLEWSGGSRPGAAGQGQLARGSWMVARQGCPGQRGAQPDTC
jgi:hypothetical protein